MIRKEYILIAILLLSNCSESRKNSKNDINYIDELEEKKICLESNATTYQDYLSKEELEEYQNINIEEWISEEEKIGEWYYYEDKGYYWLCYIDDISQ